MKRRVGRGKDNNCRLQIADCRLTQNAADLLYREAVTAQSPGLLQPWGIPVADFNRKAVAPFTLNLSKRV